MGLLDGETSFFTVCLHSADLILIIACRLCTIEWFCRLLSVTFLLFNNINLSCVSLIIIIIIFAMIALHSHKYSNYGITDCFDHCHGGNRQILPRKRIKRHELYKQTDRGEVNIKEIVVWSTNRALRSSSKLFG